MIGVRLLHQMIATSMMNAEAQVGVTGIRGGLAKVGDGIPVMLVIQSAVLLQDAMTTRTHLDWTTKEAGTTYPHGNGII
jgi:hypothetical protein